MNLSTVRRWISLAKDSNTMSERQTSTFVTRLGELPTVQWALHEVSKAYTRAREKNVLTKIGFLAMEVTTKVAVYSSKVAYNVSPIPQFVKEKIQEQGKEEIHAFL